jgi:hypothetical protein
VLLDPLRDRMVEYREAIKVEYGESHPFFASLPRIYPAPGSTPDTVTLTGQWDVPQNAAALSWTASTDPNFDHYEVRMSPGSNYDAVTATVIANMDAGTLDWLTIDGLASSGDTASFRVYVILTTGNEAGSNTLTVTRP